MIVVLPNVTLRVGSGDNTNGNRVCTGRILISDSLNAGLLMNIVTVVHGIHIIHGVGSVRSVLEDPFPCVP